MTALDQRVSRPAGTRRPLAVLAGSTAFVAYVGAVDPNTAGHYPTCPFLLVTGWYCPGCGSLRAVHALAHGDPVTALARNPLLVVSALALGWVWWGWLRRSASGASRQRVAPGWAVWGFLGVVVVYWVLRNLPGLSLLAP